VCRWVLDVFVPGNSFGDELEKTPGGFPGDPSSCRTGFVVVVVSVQGVGVL
jgi:hypothetical protein